MSIIRIDLTDDDLDQVADYFDATKRQVRLARTRALKKTAAWLRRQVLSAAAKHQRIPLRSIKDRAYVSNIGPSDDAITLAIGTMPVDVFNVGNPAQTANGVRVGRHFYPGAFVKSIYTGQEKVWIRKGSKHYSPVRYPVAKRNQAATLPGHLMGRFPVVRAAVPIHAEVERVAEVEESEIAPTFLRHFQHELNYEVNVK